MSQDYSAFVAAHLARVCPTVDPFYISQFCEQFKTGFFFQPTPEQLSNIEDNFAIHLVVLAESIGTAGGPPVLRQSQSMENRAENPQSMSGGNPFIPSYQTPAFAIPEEPSNRAVDILVGIEATFSSEAAFKNLCNIIFKGVKYFVQDPTNVINQTIPLKYEDIENNDAIFAQIQVLCAEFAIQCDAKAKGALLTFTRNDPAYVKQVQEILDAFKKHKDESLSSKAAAPVKQGKYNSMDPNREERVQAFLEAKRLRAITGPQPAIMEETPGLPNLPKGNAMESEAKLVDYPSMPTDDSKPKGPFEQPSTWNGQGVDPLAERFKYKVDDSKLTKNPHLSHQNQLNEYRNKAKFNNHDNIEPRNKFMTWGQLSNQIDIEDQEVLGKECLEWTNKFRESQGLRPLKWLPQIFNIGKII